MRSRAAGWRRAAPGTGLTGRRLAYRPEALAQAEQTLLGARLVGVGRVPLRAADGAEQHGVGVAAGGERLVGQRVPCASIAAPPKRCSS